MGYDGKVEVSSEIASPAAAVWARAVTEEGINHELAPIVRMTMPPGLRGKTIDTVEVGVELGRSWILLGGVIPVDYDDLKLVEIEPGRRFLERSRTLAVAVWTHERTVEPEGRGCRLTDRLGFEPRAWDRLDPRCAAPRERDRGRAVSPPAPEAGGSLRPAGRGGR